MPIAVRTFGVPVRLFGRYAELLASTEVTVEVAAGATVADVIAALRARHPAAKELPARPLVARALRQIALDAAVAPGDELALLPPLSGG